MDIRLKCDTVSGFVPCINARCVKKSRVCDGKDNCGDLSDELDCCKFSHHNVCVILKFVASEGLHENEII